MAQMRLIAIDLDGTLLNSQGQIDQANIDAIQAASHQGIQIVLATGRPKLGIVPYFERLGLSEQNFVISQNGTITFTTPSWDILHQHVLDKSAIRRLIDSLEKWPEASLVLMTPTQMYVVGDQVSEIVAEDAKAAFMVAKPISLEELSDLDEEILVGIYMADAKVMDIYEPEMKASFESDFHTVRGLPYLFEVLPKAVNKASSLKRVAAHLSIVPNEIMAIGDAANDIEMLQFAGLGVAMGNADETVKAWANVMTDHHDKGGVAKAIEKYALRPSTNILDNDE